MLGFSSLFDAHFHLFSTKNVKNVEINAEFCHKIGGGCSCGVSKDDFFTQKAFIQQNNLSSKIKLCYGIHPWYGDFSQVDFLELKEENDWQIDINELKNLIRPDTKMICLNNANNPTGTVLDRNILNEIVQIARNYNSYILCDEVYKPMEDIDVPSIVDIYERGISTNSLSKTYSLPGIRVGWTAASKEITEILRKYRDYTMICCGVFDDYVASLALKNKDKILKRNQQLINTNFEILKEWIKNEPKVSLVFPKHVSVSFIKIDVDMPIEEYCINLLNDTGVLLIPGNRFDVEGHARLGYCAKTEVLIEGLNRLSSYLRTF